jgi:hypothetical protein
MNDTTSVASGWDHIHAAKAAEDAERSAWLTRQVAELRNPLAKLKAQHIREGLAKSAQLRSARKLASVPLWPSWARAHPHADPVRCSTCWTVMEPPKRKTNDVRFCKQCHSKLGRHAPRVRLAVRRYRLGEWTP